METGISLFWIWFQRDWIFGYGLKEFGHGFNVLCQHQLAVSAVFINCSDKLKAMVLHASQFTLYGLQDYGYLIWASKSFAVHKQVNNKRASRLFGFVVTIKKYKSRFGTKGYINTRY